MRRSRGVVALAALAATAAVGCGSDSSSDSKAASGGTVKAATVTGVMPYESYGSDGKTLVGFEPELVDEAAKRMGMSTKYIVIGFDSLLVGLDAKRFDLVMGGMVDKAEREKRYDAVNITNDKFSWAAKQDLAAKTRSFADMCGKRLGLLAGSSYEEATKAAATKCKAEGNPMKLLNFDEDAQARLALKSGQVDYYPSNLPLLSQFVKENTDFATVGFSFLPGPTALFLQKGSALAPKLRDAIQSMVDDGTYQKILDKWGAGGVAIPKIKLNPVTGGTG